MAFLNLSPDSTVAAGSNLIWVRPAQVFSWVGLALLALLVTPFHSFANPSPISREYQLKAVFLFNFAQFTEWPTNTFATSNAPIVIGVIGIDPFGSALDETVRGETINGHKLVVERYRRIEEIGTCHILFISQSENRRVNQILAKVKGKPVLTVGDMEDSIGQNVAIRILEENNRLRIHINLNAVSQAHLSLSSKLLRAAGIDPSGQAP